MRAVRLLPSEYEVDFRLYGRVRDKTFFLVPQSVYARAWVGEHVLQALTVLGRSAAVVSVARHDLPDILGRIRSAGLTMRWVDDPWGIQGIDYDVQVNRRSLG